MYPVKWVDQKDVLGFRGVDHTYAQIRKDLTRLSVNYLEVLKLKLLDLIRS